MWYVFVLSSLKPCPHCRRKVQLSPFSRRFRRQSPFSATVWLFCDATVALFCDSVDRALSRLGSDRRSLTLTLTLTLSVTLSYGGPSPMMCVSGEPGKYEANVPLLLSAESNCPYRYLNIEGVLRAPSLMFSPSSVICGPLPLNVESSHDISICPVDFPRYFPVFQISITFLSRVHCWNQR